MTNTTATGGDTMTSKFEVGGIYATGRKGLSDYVWTFEVIGRTKCFITVQQIDHGPDGDIYRVGVKTDDWNGSEDEWALPLGSYSMAPVIRANDPKVEVAS